MKKRKLTIILLLLFIFSFSTNVFAASTDAPKIKGKSALTIDALTGEIIYEKNIDEKMYPASTTKLLTALLFTEKFNKGDTIKYTKTAKLQPPYSLNTNFGAINVGDTLSATDAMDALLIFSANDIAYAIAENVSPSTKDFENLMNDKIKKLNLKNTHFVTPNGLHDVNHYTTSYDLSVIAREAFKNPWIKETIHKEKSKITIPKGTVVFDNRNKLLSKDGCVGGKTGYTSQAGRCLVTLYEREGRPIVGVVMKSIYDKDDATVFEDMKKIIDWSYLEKKVPIYKKDSIVKEENIQYKLFRFFGPTKTIKVPLILKEDALYYNNDVNKKELKKEIKLDRINPWNLNEKKSIGTLFLKQREANTKYALYSSISSVDLIKANILAYSITLIILILLLVSIFILISKIGRKKRRRASYLK